MGKRGTDGRLSRFESSCFAENFLHNFLVIVPLLIIFPETAISDITIVIHKDIEMGIKSKRKNVKIGDSVGITYPYLASIGKFSTLAGNRLFLIDPRGEITEEELLEFMETEIEPRFYAKFFPDKVPHINRNSRDVTPGILHICPPPGAERSGSEQRRENEAASAI